MWRRAEHLGAEQHFVGGVEVLFQQSRRGGQDRNRRMTGSRVSVDSRRVKIPAREEPKRYKCGCTGQHMGSREQYPGQANGLGTSSSLSPLWHGSHGVTDGGERGGWWASPQGWFRRFGIAPCRRRDRASHSPLQVLVGTNAARCWPPQLPPPPRCVWPFKRGADGGPM